ncbi:uncharacterized protein [Miscanthus floridulus]|uniref:uncharacterized protein n=1 Tax=Miscanthus floridulus TaxID=154761 RepID=UPI00345883B5
MTDGSEMGDSSGTAVAALPRPEAVVGTVREVSDTSWPTLTRTNYGEWSVTMKVKLRARWLWNAVDKDTKIEEDDMSALEAILAAVPVEYRESLETKSSAKEAWESIAAMRTLISKLKSHGVTIDEDEAISKYLNSVPAKYIQIALSIETMLDLSTLTIEDMTGRLWVVDERLEQAIAMKDRGKLLLTEEWADRRNSEVASSSCDGDGKCCGKASSEKKKLVDPNACRHCGKIGHWARECPNRK